MKKKNTPTPRPQPAQIQAIERCIRHGDLNEANKRLRRLQTAFPNFKPLKHLAFEIARKSGHTSTMAAAAWDWCEASSNSVVAFGALLDASLGHYPYLFHYATKRLHALGEPIPDEAWQVRESFKDSINEEDGLRLDLSRVFMGTGRLKEARALVETLDYPEAQNNFAQILFTEGDIERATEIFESILAKNPSNHFALYRLATLRLWLSGKAPAADLNERLQAIVPAYLDELRHQMESALFFDQAARADEIYRSAPNFPWYDESCEYAPESSDTIHYLGAMAAWRLGNRPEALERIKEISKDNDEYAEINAQCFLANIDGDTPDWTLSNLPHWWPMSRIMLFHAKKLENDAELFDNWRVPTPHFDYLIAVVVNGGGEARFFALSLLMYLASKGGDLREGAKQAMLEIMRLPCGPDRIRTQIQATMVDEKLLDDKTPVKIFSRGQLIEARPLTITIIDGPTGKETVFSAADAKHYKQLMDSISDGDLSRALEISEDLLSRYPDYPRILVATASLRQGNDEPFERWAPLIRRAAEIKPDYFFSRIGMAHLLVAEDKAEEAMELLKPLLEREEMHRSEWRALIGAQISIARARNDLFTLARLREMLLDCDRPHE